METFIQSVIKGCTQWLSEDTTINVPSNNVQFSYIVKYSGQTGKTDCLPMLIALHGDGDSANGFYESALNEINIPARIILVKGPIAHQIGYVWPFSVAQFEDYGTAFSEAVNLLATRYPTVNKPVLLGFSGGGGMAYYQAVLHGDNYSSIFSVSSLLAKVKLGAGRSMPGAEVYAYHGKSDEVIAFSDAIKTCKLLKKNKVRVNFTEFDSGHQGFFTDMKSQIIQAIAEKLSSL